MNTIHPMGADRRRPGLRAPALAGILLATLVAGTALPARAGLLYSAQDRSVFAQVETTSAPVEDSAASTAGGTFDETVAATVDSNRADATQTSTLGTDTIAASGGVSVLADSGTIATSRADTRFSVAFTLDEDAAFELGGEVFGFLRFREFRSQNNGRGDAGLTLANGVGDVILEFQVPYDVGFDIPDPCPRRGGDARCYGLSFLETGTLLAGDYSLTAFADASGSYSSLTPFGGNGLADARFDFTFTTSALPEPVPGPATGALLLTGGLVAFARRRGSLRLR
jgi:hypothetical protein